MTPTAPADADTDGTTRGGRFGREAHGPERSGAGAALGVLVVVVLAVAAGYVWAVVNAGDRLPSGTTVAGVDVGGLQPAAAEVTLRNALTTTAEGDVPLVVAGRQVARPAASIGLSVDYAASIDRAVRSPQWLPANLWNFYTGGERLDAVVDVDRDALLSLLDDLVADSERAPVEGQVLIRADGYEVVEPVVGAELDRRAAVAAVRQGWLQPGPVELPLQPAVPEIDAGDVERAVADIAEPVVQGPVALRAGDDSVPLTLADYAGLVSLVPAEGRLALAVSADRLPLRVSLALRQAGALEVGRDASVRVVDGKPEVVAARGGQRVDTAPLVQRFREAVLATDPADRGLRVPLVEQQPTLTTAEAEDLRVTESVATVTVPYPRAAFRDTNLPLAAAELDGTLLPPGEELSFNETVGPPTPDRGFVAGPLYDDGETSSGAGAGLSRLATALTSAAWRAGLDLADREPMPWHPAEYPIGVDAAVAYGSVDLVVANPSPFGVLVTADVTDREVTVELWSTRWREVRTSLSAFTDQQSPPSQFVEGPACVGVAGQPGFDVTATRTLVRPGGGPEIRTDELATSYRPLPNIVCVGP